MIYAKSEQRRMRAVDDDNARASRHTHVVSLPPPSFLPHSSLRPSLLPSLPASLPHSLLPCLFPSIRPSLPSLPPSPTSRINGRARREKLNRDETMPAVLALESERSQSVRQPPSSSPPPAHSPPPLPPRHTLLRGVEPTNQSFGMPALCAVCGTCLSLPTTLSLPLTLSLP